MKLKICILTLASASVGYAASIDVTNFGGAGTDVVVTDNIGEPLSNVFSYILTFSGNAPTTAEELRTLNPTFLSGNNDAAGLVAGGFSNTFSGTGNDANIYVLFLNSAEVSTSTLFGLVNTGEVFNVEVPPAIDSNTYVLGEAKGEAVIGTFGGEAASRVDWTDVTGISSVGSNSFRLATVIPEPSAVLLGGLALLGGLVRRRR